MRLPQGVLEMRLLGARSRGASGLDPLPGRSNLLGDRSRWRTDIPTYGRVRFERVYSGIDLVYHGNQRHLESDFVVAPGADPGKIRLAFRGQKGIAPDADGNLVLSLVEGELRQHRPVAYQEMGGERRAVECAYRLDARGEVGFQLGAYDRRQPLVIDPVLVYSGRFGGSSADTPQGVAVDSSGNAYVVGSTSSTDFPTVNPKQATKGVGLDVFITKVNAAGTAIVYSTYIGGSRDDYGYGIAVDGWGNAWFTGYTGSSDFPWTGTSNFFVGYVAKLNASGNGVLVAVPIGLYGNAIAVDGSGNAYAAGWTRVYNVPAVNALQPVAAGGDEAWVAKFSSSGAIVYSTYLGGSQGDYAYGIAVDGLGSACVAGQTNSTNFPVLNAMQPTSGGNGDAFVAKLTPAGNALVFSTYLGGSSSDTAEGVAMDSSGNCYVSGQTSSANFPTVNAAQATRASAWDAFVTAYNSTGTAYLYSTYLGGGGDDDGKSIAVSPTGVAWVTGGTSSLDFPVTADAFQSGPGGGIGGVFEQHRWGGLDLSRAPS